MLKDKTLIVFSDEWGRHPSSCEHIVKILLGYGNRVIWVNTIGMRTPQLTLYDMFRSIEKLARWVKNASIKQRRHSDKLTVLDPIMLPYNNIPIIRHLNKLSVNRSLTTAINYAECNNPIVVASVTNVADYVGLCNASAVVYYCVDDYVEWPGIDKRLVVEMEENLLKASDLVLATADDLCRKKERAGKTPYFLPHGVDFDHFNVSRSFLSPSELLRGIKPPIIGFFGAISAWLDFELLEYTATARPDWSFVLIGPVDTDAGKLCNIPNIHLVGKVPYGELPRQAIHFDVGIIPFVINELTISVNPLKLIEYFACGVPVVSTDLPEVRKFDEITYIANDPSSFVACIAKALLEDNEEKRQKRKSIASAYSWEAVTERFSTLVETYVK